MINAFYDGSNAWRARVYVSEAGAWKWSSRCESDSALDGKSGQFVAAASKLHGRLLVHPRNPRQWITEDGRWFLNLNDTAYFLLCRFDANGQPIPEQDARDYVRDVEERGVTSLRCFLASSERGFRERVSNGGTGSLPTTRHRNCDWTIFNVPTADCDRLWTANPISPFSSLFFRSPLMVVTRISGKT